MNTSDDTSASNPSSDRRAPRWTLPVILITVIVCAFALKMILPPRWHALLELKNTGAKPMTVAFKGRSSVTKPGETWKGEFRASDTITIRSREAATGASHIITMPAKNPKPWTSTDSTVQHWTAEVNADDPDHVRVEKRVWTEVTNPPSPWLPWPN